jgi:hypothetical protein
VSPDVRVDAETGRLLLSERAWDALLHAGEAGEREAPAELGAALADLRAAGVMREGRLPESLTRVAGLVAAPSAELELARGGSAARGWIAPAGAALLVPRGEDLRELVAVAPHFLPELLARLVELGPRTASQRSPRTLSPGELAQAIARTASSTLPVVRDHWRVELRPASTGAPERLEALDSEDGWWELRRAGNAVLVAPVSASHLWRSLVRLVVRGLPGTRRSERPG